MPTAEYFEATMRGDLAAEIAHQVKEVERTVPGGLETKEIRNVVSAVLRNKLYLEYTGTVVDPMAARLVSRWQSGGRVTTINVGDVTRYVLDALELPADDSSTKREQDAILRALTVWLGELPGLRLVGTAAALGERALPPMVPLASSETLGEPEQLRREMTGDAQVTHYVDESDADNDAGAHG